MSTLGIKKGRISSTRTGLSEAEYKPAITNVNGPALLPAGTIFPFAGTTPPAGWMLCNGPAISRTTYSELFAAISTAWGVGDNSTTFNIPDLRGAFLRGGGSQVYTNTYTGPSVGGHQLDKFNQHIILHTHDTSGYSSGHAHMQYTAWLGVGTGGRRDHGPIDPTKNTLNSYPQGVATIANTLTHQHSISAANATYGGDIETRPYAKGINFIIKY